MEKCGSIPHDVRILNTAYIWWIILYLGNHVKCSVVNSQSISYCSAAICTCTDPTNICIMAANTSAISPATTWSSCSVSYLNEGYRLNLDRCLFNTPRRTLEDPVCGNGIREGDETCDCGSFEVNALLKVFNKCYIAHLKCRAIGKF